MVSDNVLRVTVSHREPSCVVKSPTFVGAFPLGIDLPAVGKSGASRGKSRCENSGPLVKNLQEKVL